MRRARSRGLERQDDRVRVLTCDVLDALLDDAGRHELIDGQLVLTPAPSSGHQTAVLELPVRLREACPSGLRCASRRSTWCCAPIPCSSPTSPSRAPSIWDARCSSRADVGRSRCFAEHASAGPHPEAGDVRGGSAARRAEVHPVPVRSHDCAPPYGHPWTGNSQKGKTEADCAVPVPLSGRTRRSKSVD